ncbi:MAG: hypothetical protein NWE92_12060 [Candidatus Bathyarchaeota archaeon]|nr:hypothetical protein [Candidatus Bathyarchaeota archaeon]
MILYKYLPTKYYSQFKKSGLVHLSALNCLRNCEKQQIGDKNEGIHTITIGKQNPVSLTGKEVRSLIPASLLNVSDETRVIMNNSSFSSEINGYVFCSTIARNDNYWATQGYDAHFSIIKPIMFAKTILDKLRIYFGITSFSDGLVVYPKNKIETPFNFLPACFQKDLQFSIQKEYRMLFPYENASKSITIDCPEILRYCSFE